MENKFETGVILATNAVKKTMIENPKFSIFCQKCLEKHSSGDWGDLEEEDKESNDFSLENEGRIFSSYKFSEDLQIQNEEKIWIITECNRDATTLLFPSEY